MFEIVVCESFYCKLGWLMEGNKLIQLSILSFLYLAKKDFDGLHCKADPISVFRRTMVHSWAPTAFGCGDNNFGSKNFEKLFELWCADTS